ncbi:STAS domain-containing protein [Jannaschia sp. M317]|uniref:STAS domain-containing protein n=1 Tax=Jannaschia sp. M317 TaxID=2867011 RepID=UPI0021A4A7B8|nr:STAS domain-containing protein [Jannaschia sp. M317]UWQ17719.1 STAS domain-containing protein [Jannaschia sp. M317]
MEISRETHGDMLALTLCTRRLDAAGALSFKERFRSETADHTGRVVLDMDEVDFLDSSGLGALVAAMKSLPPDRKLELARCGPIVSKVLKLTRMDSVFVMHDALPWSSSGKDAA